MLLTLWSHLYRHQRIAPIAASNYAEQDGGGTVFSRVSRVGAPHNCALHIMGYVAERVHQPVVDLLGEQRFLAIVIDEVKERVPKPCFLFHRGPLRGSELRWVEGTFGHGNLRARKKARRRRLGGVRRSI